jgi:hypothetical protein
MLVLLYEPNLAIHRSCPIKMFHPHTNSGRVYAKLESVVSSAQYYGRGSDMGLYWRRGIRIYLFSRKHCTEIRRPVLY